MFVISGGGLYWVEGPQARWIQGKVVYAYILLLNS